MVPSVALAKNEVWAIDELQLISPDTGKKVGFHKVLCATDLFSNFCIVDQVKGNLDAKQVLDFVQQKIISVFGYPRILVTDNATCMNNQLVSQTCALLNIHFCTIAPYSAKSNLQELLNRAILDTLRALTSNHYSPPSVSAQMIGPVVNLINSLTFRELKNISPYFLQFCKKPKVDPLVFYFSLLYLLTNMASYPILGPPPTLQEILMILRGEAVKSKLPSLYAVPPLRRCLDGGVKRKSSEQEPHHAKRSHQQY